MDYVGLVNTAGCALVSLALAWAVLNPRLHHGVLAKLGLSAMALGFVALTCVLPTEGAGETIARAGALIYAGAAIALLGWVLRTRGRTRHLRRFSDWGEFYGQSPQPPRRL